MTRNGRRAAPRSRRRRAVLALAGATAAAAVLLGAGVPPLLARIAPVDEVTGTSVGLDCAGVPDGLVLGVVVSSSSPRGEGSEWKDAANGAVVAEQRFALGGCAVRLVAADDHGTAEGAREAVETLLQADVSGLVLATTGSHVSAAVAAARSAGVAAMLPHGSDPAGGSGLLGPDPAEVAAVLAERAGDGALLLDAGGGPPSGLAPVAILSVDPRDPAAAVTAAAPHLLGEERVGHVVVTGPATAQADVVAALQSSGTTAEIFLTPDALSPAFAPALLEAGGTLSGALTSVGADTGDAVALRTDDRGRAMSAFLAAVRRVAEDPRATAVLGDRPFREVAAVADAASHDAVVALVRAAASAGTTAPAAIAAALDEVVGGGSTTPPDSLLGSGLRPPAAVLHAAPQRLGLRPADPPLLWFAEPERPEDTP